MRLAEAVGVQLAVADLPAKGRLIPDLEVVHFALVDERTTDLFLLEHHILYEAGALATVDPIDTAMPGGQLEGGRLG